MFSAIAIGQVDVRDAALQLGNLARGIVGQRQVRNVHVGLSRRVIHVVQKTRHAFDVVDERKMKRFDFDRELET